MDFLEREEVFCSHGGCEWIGKYCELTGHMSSCDHNPDKIPDIIGEDLPDCLLSSEMRRRLLAKIGTHRVALNDASNRMLINLSDSELD